MWDLTGSIPRSRFRWDQQWKLHGNVSLSFVHMSDDGPVSWPRNSIFLNDVLVAYEDSVEFSSWHPESCACVTGNGQRAIGIPLEKLQHALARGLGKQRAPLVTDAYILIDGTNFGKRMERVKVRGAGPSP